MKSEPIWNCGQHGLKGTEVQKHVRSLASTCDRRRGHLPAVSHNSVYDGHTSGRAVDLEPTGATGSVWTARRGKSMHFPSVSRQTAAQ